MDKELLPGAPNSSLPPASPQLGLSLPAGTGFDPKRIQFLKEIRTLFPDTKITISTYSKYWSEFSLFDYFDDVAAIDDGNEEGLKNIILERDIDLPIEMDSGIRTARADGNSALEYWRESLKFRRNIPISSEITGNIYVKDRIIAVGEAELHEDIGTPLLASGPVGA